MNTKSVFNILKKIIVHAFCLGCVLAAVFGALFFIQYKFVQPATAKSQKYYINDIYDQPITQLEDGVTFEQQFEAHGDIYGVQIRWHNLAQVQDGTALIEVADGETGEIVAGTTYDLHRIVNDVYNEIAFDAPYLNSEEGYQPYVLRITPAFDNPEESYLKIWGDYSTGTIAFGVLKYIVNTESLYGWFGMLRTVSLVAAVAVYAVCFIFKLKKEAVFAVTLLAVSCLFTMVLPPYSSPDEEGHFNSAYRLTNRWEGLIDDESSGGTIYKREGDSNKIVEEKYTSPLTYEYIYQHFGDKAETDQLEVFDGMWLVNDFNGVYFMGAVGIKLARMLGLGYLQMLYLGRLMNLLFFAVCLYFSIKITPLGKEVFMALGMLPITLHIANSFSRDVFVISLGFLFTAYLLYLLKQEQTYRWWQLLIMAVICALLAPSKFIYAVMCIGVLLLDTRKVPLLNRIKWRIHPLVICALAAVVICPLMLKYLLDANPEFRWKIFAAAPLKNLLNPATADFEWSLQLIVQNPVYFMKMLMNTVYTNGAYYISSLFGGVLSYNSIFTSNAFVVITIVCVAVSVFGGKDDTLQLAASHRITFGGIFLLVFAELMLMCIFWTFVRMDTLYGFQGKYLLPVLPMLLIALKGKAITVNRDLFRPLCFIMAFTDIFVALNACTVILQR